MTELQGLSIPVLTPESVPKVISLPVFDVEERTNLAVATFDSLGLVGDKGALRDDIAGRMETLRDTLGMENFAQGHVEPFMAIDLSEKFPLSALVAAFDKIQPKYTYVYSQLWSQYSNRELNNRTVDELRYRSLASELIKRSATATNTMPVPQKARVWANARAILLGVDTTLRERGHYFNSLDLGNQIRAVGLAAENHSKTHTTDLCLLSPADYILVNAQRREAGEPSLDSNLAVSRFVQLRAKSVDGHSWVPSTVWFGHQLSLNRSNQFSYAEAGVRLSVGLEA